MVNVIDCTIRDGSYATGYQWDNNVLRDLVSTLEKAGIDYIEIGNGTGLGMYRNNSQAKPDNEYFENTIPYKGNAKIGAFFIPGTGTNEDLKHFREAGGDFVRIGTNCTETEKALEYVSYARDLGFYVCANLMKTYAISAYQMAYKSHDLIKAGAQCLYVVDSAGCMLPEEVERYFSAMRQLYDVSLGFHGHNNLMFANANSYTAVKSGADFVDATLMSLGRGAGNAQLESLVALFQKEGVLDDSIDVTMLSNLSERAIANVASGIKGMNKRDIVIGLARFHDSYMPLVNKYASQYNIDPDVLITEVSKINVVKPSADLFEEVSQRLASATDTQIFFPKFSHKYYK